ncbi:MAG: glycine zipper 2TM domain-containing protein [Xanthomonadaceae bacterium]|nr:glycine zipper 2TM domain-containing protein [Xanthomonadaceae bacterium]
MRYAILLAPGFLALLLAGLGFAPPAEARGYRCGQCGTVEDVDRIWYEGRRDRGTGGAVLGAIIGGALGNQVGKGDGRKAATIAGAVVGGLVGRDIDRNDGRGGRGEEGLRLTIRMDRGYYQTVEIHGDMRIYRGDRVRLRDGRVDLID